MSAVLMDPVVSNRTGIPRYRRLPGLRFGGGFARAALRIADDHLLLCDFRMSFIERYKRFYFRDIEAFVIRKTPVWFGAIAAWLAVAALIYVMASSARWNGYVTISLEGICALFLLRNLIRGPSCRTHVQTAVQTDVLPMLNRVRKTRRVFQQLFPLIQEAQAKAVPNERLTTSVAQSPLTSTAATARPDQPVAAEPVSRQRAPLSFVHLGTFFALLLAGAAALLNVTTRSPWSFVVMLILFFAAGLGGICSLIFQVKHSTSRAAAAAAWLVVIGCFMGGIGVNAGYCWYDMFLRAQSSRVPPHFRQVSPLTMRVMPGFDYVLWVFGFAAVTLGLLGLISVFMPAFARPEPPPLPKPATA